MNKHMKVLVYVPNLIGYFRFILLLIAWNYIEFPQIFLPSYIVSVLLDGVDGWAARKLNQVSDFGAWLDVVVDIIGRGFVWCYLGKFGYAVPAWEWIVFVANHSRSDSGQWKEHFKKAPLLVQKVMEHGFKTVLGTIAICGLNGLPIWIYVGSHSPEVTAIYPLFSVCLFSTFIFGRLLSFVVEFWCVYIHLYDLTEVTGKQKTSKN